MTRSSARRAAVLLAAILAASVGAVSRLAGQARSADTVVLTAKAPLHPGVATLERQLTLSADEFQFSTPFLYPGLNGTVFVVDLRDPNNVGAFEASVRQYDAQGKFLRTIGRIGRGPGEFIGGIGGVAQLSDGRILLSDRAGVLVYSPDGRSVGRWNATAAAVNIGSEIMVDPAGFIYVHGAIRNPDRTRTFFLHRFRLDGTLIDSVPTLASEFIDSRTRAQALVPFFPRYVWSWSSLGYYVTAHTSSYAVDLRQPPPAARLSGLDWTPAWGVRSIRSSTRSVPVLPAERADWKQSAIMFIRSSLRNESFKWEGEDVPATKPPIREVQVGADGRIWVRLFQTAVVDPTAAIQTRPARGGEGYSNTASQRWTEPRVFDVFEPSGTYIGRVQMPDKDRGDYPHSRYVARGDTVWAVTFDSDDLPSISRFLIRWSALNPP